MRRSDFPRASADGLGDRDAREARPEGGGLSRRDLFKLLGLSGLIGACRSRPYARVDFPLAPHSNVALLPASHYGLDLAEVIGRGLRLLHVDVTGRRVLLKPNMVEYEGGSAINTHPAMVVAAAVALRRAGAREVVVAEGPGHRRDVEYLLTSSGLHDHLREERIRFVDLNHDDVAWTKLKSRFTGLTHLALPVELLKADLVVSMPKLKTHHWAGMTASLKNLFGTVPGAVYGWPKNVLHTHGIENSILDLASTIRPRLAIVDAVIAMEGDGPIMGRPRAVGAIAMGTDPVAVDATCARMIGVDPARIPYLETASGFLGHIDQKHIDQLAEPWRRFAGRFDLPAGQEALRLAE
jgi:uncharacterized protein (DUF362 family)